MQWLQRKAMRGPGVRIAKTLSRAFKNLYCCKTVGLGTNEAILNFSFKRQMAGNEAIRGFIRLIFN